MAIVTRIAATKSAQTLTPFDAQVKRRVAGYARVSTDSDEQYTSYEAQIENYEKEIKKHQEWEFVKIYADEGLSGTKMKSRKSFMEMIEDCKAGKIDLIVTKSISRFARNTVDAISTTRELKKIGVEVFFEKENLWTFDSKTEMALTIYCSLAQEESHSISQNVTMGKRWNMAKGKVTLPYKQFLGYDKGEDGKPAINEEQAIIVKLIYKMFLLEGYTSSGIAKFLNDNGIKTPSGKEGAKWQKNVIDSILGNEKYKGDALLQKGYVPDFLDHKVVKNNGELDMYYVKNHHEPIIDEDIWNQVQAEKERRSLIGHKYSSTDIFASKLVCSCCGGFYGKKVWHSNDKYKKIIYQCNQKFSKEKEKCNTPTLDEAKIKELFIKAYNLVMKNKNQVIEDTEMVIELLTNTSEIEAKIQEAATERDVTAELGNKLLEENKRVIQNQDEFEKKYTEFQKRHDAAKLKISKLKNEIIIREGKRDKMRSFLARIKESPDILTMWNDEVWMLMVESGTVNADKSITFKFYNGTIINVK